MPGTISFDGLATGINTTELVDKLITVDSRPKILKEAEKVRLENQLSAWREVNTQLLGVKAAAVDLSQIATWSSATVTTSDDTVLTATAGLGAPDGTYLLYVDQIAKRHQIATPANPAGGDGGYASENSLVGTGDLKLTVAGAMHSFSLAAGNNSLAGVAKAINDAKIGVGASVIYNGSGYQLLLTARDTGAANAISVDASGVDTTGTRALDAWATVQAAEDAKVSLGSGAGKITVTSASNTVSTLLQGVTLNLRSAAPGRELSVTVSRSADTLAEKVQGFVDAYNGATSFITQQFSYDAGKNAAGVLMGDAKLLRIQRALGSLLTGAVATGSDYRTLASVGLTRTSQGTLAFDPAKFKTALQKDYEGVMQLFRTTGTSSNVLVSFVRATGATKEGTYEVAVTKPATRAAVAGAAAAGLTVSENDTFTVSVDGGGDVAVTLARQTYASAADLAHALDTQIELATGRKVTVAADPSGVLTISSDRYGSASTIRLGGEATLAALGFTDPGTRTASGQDVEGTLNGEAATGNGQILAGKKGNQNTDGLQVLARLDAPGTAAITVRRGILSQVDDYLAGLTDPVDGALEGAVTSLDRSVKAMARRIQEMQDRLDERRQRLLAQFTRMESAISQLNGQSTFLTNALAGLSKGLKSSS